MPSKPPLYDCIVVGAGISGLFCARQLDQAGRRVLVLEARDRVGGRTLSRNLNSDIVDLGGQWIGPTQNRVAALCDELQIQTFPQYTKGRKVMVMGDEVRTYSGLIPKMPLRALLESGFTMWRLDRQAGQVKDVPHSRRLRAWDKLSVAQWMDRHIKHPETRKIMNVATQMVFAAEPQELSFLFFLYYIKSGQGLNRLTMTDGGAQQTRFTTGAQSMCLRMAEGLPNRVRLNHQVTAIEQRNDHLAVEVRAKSSGRSKSGGRQELTARKLVLALPPPLINKIQFNPILPSAREELHTRMPMGSVIKFVVAYKEPFWRKMGFSGEVVFTDGPVRALFDDCSDDLKQSALVGFIIADSAKEYSQMPKQKRHTAIIEAIAKAFGPQAKEPIALLEQDWISEEFSQGCYVGVMPPGLMTRTAAALRQPVGDIHFAGTETATRWNGYFDGAIEAGQRAAGEVIESLG